MKKLLVTTAMSLSLMVAGATFAADNEKTVTDSKPYHQHVEAMGHGKFLASLSKEKAELFHTSMKQAHEKNESLHAQVKSLYAELSVITKAATFDEKAYISKSAEISNLQTTMHNNKAEALAGFLAKLNQDERSKFADSMKNMHKNRHHKDVSGDAKTSDATKKN